jgi:hypothetical protein
LKWIRIFLLIVLVLVLNFFARIENKELSRRRLRTKGVEAMPCGD